MLWHVWRNSHHKPTYALYFQEIVECVFLINYYVKDKRSTIKYCSSETFSHSHQLVFFPNRVWALRKSVHLSKRITFSGLQTAETHVPPSNITPTSGLCTCHKLSCCNAQSYQLPCNKSCCRKAYFVQLQVLRHLYSHLYDVLWLLWLNWTLRGDCNIGLMYLLELE